ncbi:hypothetical protein EBU94_06365 [bacterium]|nr:hypothetical protein [bacterium]
MDLDHLFDVIIKIITFGKLEFKYKVRKVSNNDNYSYVRELKLDMDNCSIFLSNFSDTKSIIVNVCVDEISFAIEVYFKSDESPFEVALEIRRHISDILPEYKNILRLHKIGLIKKEIH